MEIHNLQLQEIKDFTEKTKTCLFVTQTKESHLRARPMMTANTDETGAVWFYTNEFNSKVKDIWKNNEVLVTYTSLSSDSYLTIKGIASLSYNKNDIMDYWDKKLTAWFPAGLDDPNIILIKVDLLEAEYWNGVQKKIFKKEQKEEKDHEGIYADKISGGNNFITINI